MSKQRTDVFISSTSIDLPDHRAAVQQAILSLGLFPSGMENWPVAGESPVDLCRQKVQAAEIYIGIYAHRYGWRPDGPGTKSITEMEYDWAADVQRGGEAIPRLCFIMDDDYPFPVSKMELDAKTDLDNFKSRVKQAQVGFFKSPDDLKAQVLAALAPYAQTQNIQVPPSYLRRLYDQSMQNDLLNALQPRDLNSEFNSIKIEQVYTALNSRGMVYRDKGDNILPSGVVEKLKQTAQRKKKSSKDNENELSQTPLTLMEAADLNNRLVLLGDPGSGKSTFLKFLILCLTGHALYPKDGWLDKLAVQRWTHGDNVPIVIILRDFAQDIPSDAKLGTAKLLLDHLQRQLAKVGELNTFSALQSALENGRSLVLLDGLDEVPDERRELIKQVIADLMITRNPANRYIVTCRILSYTNPAWKLKGMIEETIAPLDSEKASQFISAWYTALHLLEQIVPDLAEARIADLTSALKDRQLQSMASNPMLLTVMAIVHNHTGALPRETARLYEECVELLLRKWHHEDAEKLLTALGVSDDILYRLLWEIAYDAHNKQGDREGAADISEADIIGLSSHRFNGDLTKAKLFANYIYERSGLLHGRGQDAHHWRVFAFPHRTFQEYLAGCYLASDRFRNKAIEHARRGKAWRDVLLLAAGHLRFNDRRISDTLEAVGVMLRSIPLKPTDEDWQIVWLAGDMLALVGLTSIQEDVEGPTILKDAQTKLAQLVSEGYLSPVERAAAARTLDRLGDPRRGVGLRPNGLPNLVWCEVSAGSCMLGVEEDKDNPLRTVHIDQFWITKYLITYCQFQSFLNDPDGYANPNWWQSFHIEALNQQQKGAQPQEFQYWNHPRDTVSWYEAMAFCAWLSSKLGQIITLPTEDQWEKAARGTDGRVYSFGNDFDPAKANTAETGIGMTSAVGIFPDPFLPYGIMDICGNVLEWCLNDDSGKMKMTSNEEKKLCGGSWVFGQVNAQADFHIGLAANGRVSQVGFRVATMRSPSSFEA